MVAIGEGLGNAKKIKNKTCHQQRKEGRKEGKKEGREEGREGGRCAYIFST